MIQTKNGKLSRKSTSAFFSNLFTIILPAGIMMINIDSKWVFEFILHDNNNKKIVIVMIIDWNNMCRLHIK